MSAPKLTPEFPPHIKPVQFSATYCSQCGGEFGPGEQGYSHCTDHAARTPKQPVGVDSSAHAGEASTVSADLHRAIMNLPCSIPPMVVDDQAYKLGHRDARHAAAELAIAAHSVNWKRAHDDLAEGCAAMRREHRRMKSALRLISEWPEPESDTVQSEFMRAIALDALKESA